MSSYDTGPTSSLWCSSDIDITISFRCEFTTRTKSVCYRIAITFRYRLLRERKWAISEWYRSDISLRCRKGDIADMRFQYQLTISKIDIVMISWILISADIGCMSADMIRYVGYRLATRGSSNSKPDLTHRPFRSMLRYTVWLQL